MRNLALQVIATLLLCVYTADAQFGPSVVLISDDTTISAGDTALLTCVAYSPNNEAITWTLNGEEIMNSSTVMTDEREIPGNANFKQSFLQICSLELSDAGGYVCSVGTNQGNATTQLTVSRGATVEVISNDAAVEMGETTVLTCVGSMAELEWSFNGAPVVNNSLVTIYEQDIVRGGRVFKQSFLQICSITLSSVGGYTCIASDGKTISNATTQVTGGPAEILAVSMDTASDVGQSALLTCVGFGEPGVEISWGFNGAPVVNTSLATVYEEDIVKGGNVFKQSFLQLCSLALSDAGDYTCIARNGLTIVTATTQLTGGVAEILAISMETSSNVGQAVILTCLASGDPGVEISWSFNGEPVVNTPLITIYIEDIVKGGRIFKRSFLQLCSLTLLNAGDYTCIARSGLTIASATTRLTGGAAEVVAVSADVSSYEGATALLTCLGIAEPGDVEYSWNFNGAPVVNTSLVTVYEEDVVKGGRVFKQLHVQLCSLTVSIAGSYTCTVRSGLTAANAITRVAGDLTEIVAISMDTLTNEGETALLTCMGFGEPDVEISWSFNGEPVVNTSLIFTYEEDIVKGGRVFKQSFLQLCSINMSYAGDYTCIARNGLTIVDATTLLTVGVREVVAISADTSSNEGETALLTCLAFGEPDVDISWSFDGEVVSNTALITIYEESTVKGGRVFKQSFLQLCSLTVSIAGSYTCMASNGGVTTDNAITRVTGGVAQILAISTDTFSDVGETTLLTCMGSGEPNVEISWNFDGVPVVNTSLITIYEEDFVKGGKVFTRSFLQLCSLAGSNAGSYTCIVRNGLTIVDATTQLHVGPAEVAVISADTSSDVGGAALLTCVGFGEIGVEISWSFNGAPVVNTSLITIYEEDIFKGGKVFRQSQLQLCSLTLSDAGDYTCIATSGLTVDNATTQLNGGEAEVVILSNDTSINVGETIVLTCVGFGELGVDISWSLNGAPIVDSTFNPINEDSFVRGGRSFKQSFLQLCSIGFSGERYYTCTIRSGLTTVSSTTLVTVQGLPSAEIAVLSDDTFLDVGETTIVVCIGLGEPDVDLSWSLNGVPLVNTSLVNIYEEPIAKGLISYKLSSLQLCSLALSDTGNYTCTASNDQVVASASTQLYAVGPVDVVVISDDASLEPGESTLLTCVGFGEPFVDISWSFKGAPVVNTSLITIYEREFTKGGRSFKQSFLQLCGLSVPEGGGYTCTASNGLADVSATTQLSVSVGPVEVVVISSDTALDVGGTTLLACVGFGEPVVEISWRYNGAPIVNTSLITIYEQDFISGGRNYTKSFLLLCSIGLFDGGDYTCIASNSHVTANATTQLTAIVGPVEVVLISNDTALDAGETVLLTCVGFGDPDVEISWRFSGAPVVNNSVVAVYENAFFKGGRNFKQSFLQLCSPPVLANGDYTCVANNGLITTNATTELTVTAGAVEVVLLSSNTSLKEEQSTVLTCVGYGEPDVEISWSFNGAPVVNTSLITVYDRRVFREVAYKQSFLELCSQNVSDSGDYTCIANNGHDTTNAITRVGVTIYAVEISAISNDTAVGDGETAILACLGYGELDYEFIWSFKGAPIVNSSLTAIYEEDIIKGGRVFRQSFLELCGTSMSSLGTYTCTIRNSRRSTSSTVQLIRGLTRVAATVISNGQQVSQEIGSDVSFECRAIGYPLPTINWYKDGDLITASRTDFRITMTTELQGSPDVVEISISTLRINDISASNAGMYTCRATNVLGADSLRVPYSLTVEPPTSCPSNPCQNGGRCTATTTCLQCDCAEGFTGITCNSATTTNTAPVLTTGPETGYAPLFGTVSFNCTASGSPQPRIQWYKNGSPLNGQTCPVLMVDGVSLSDRGFYHCTATNAQGTVTSDTAALHINDTRQITIPVLITKPGSGPFLGLEDLTAVLSQQRMDDITQFITVMSARAGSMEVNGSNSTSILLYRIQPFDDPITLIPTAVENGAILNLVVTLYAPSGTLIITPEVRNNTQRLIEELARQLGVSNFNVQIDESIPFDGCPSDVESLIVDGQERGTLTWTETAIGTSVALDCPCGQVAISRQANRVCGGDFVTGGRWMESNVTGCQFDALAWELCSAVDIGAVNMKLSDTTRMKTPEAVIIATGIVENNVNTAMGNTSASDDLFDTIDNLLKTSPDLLKDSQEEFNISGRLLGVIDQLTGSYPIQQTPQCFSRGTFGCCLYPAISNEALTFSPQLGDNIQLQGSANPSLSITLPASLSSAVSSQPAVSFCVYNNGSLFIRRDSYLVESGQTSTTLGSHVVGARLSMGVMAANLEDPVRMSFTKIQDGRQPSCTFWDQSLDSGYGSWSSEGCKLVGSTEDTVSCECNHLTNFGILVDTSVSNDETIGRFSIIGAIFLLLCALFVIINSVIAQCYTKNPIPVAVFFLLNLCIGFICLNISFIISSFVGGSETTCKAFSFFFHYFLLVSCAALATMAFFTGVIKPFDGKKRFVYLGAIAASWIFPIIVVVICIGASPESYYRQDVSPFCGPVSEPYWYGMLLIGGIFLVFTAIFIILTPIVRAKSTSEDKSAKSRWNTDYISFLSMSVFFYLAWGFGLPSVHPLNIGAVRVLFQVIFIVTSCLLGVLIVVLSLLLYNPCRKTEYPFRAAHATNENVYNDNVFMMEKKEDEDNISFTLPDYDDLQFDSQNAEGDDDKEDLGDMLARAEF